ncbi:MAG: L,D-transpeptidase family protein [Terriglobales bacterium]
MRGVVTAVWFLGVMTIGAIAGVELAHYRQSELIREGQGSARVPAEKPQAREMAKAQAPVPKRFEAPPARFGGPPAQRAKPSKVDIKIASSTILAQSSRRAVMPPPPRPEKPAPSPALPPPAVVAPSPVPEPAPLEAIAGSPPVPRLHAKGDVRIVISLPAQRAYVFKDGELWDSSRVSTGRKGRRTPVGTYTILEKAVRHRSNKYSNAPMPYMQRITWGGVALHAGVVPGYPASHGCIRLPRSFAKRLYKITNFSSTVVVTDKSIGSAKAARTAS